MTTETTQPGFDRWLTSLPWWWSIIAWVAVDGATVYQADGVAQRITAGALMVIASVAMWRTAADDDRLRTTAIVVVCAAGLGAILAAPNGLGYVPFVIAVGRLASIPSKQLSRALMIGAAILFGATVGWASHSIAGLLAGLAVPVLYQRVAERQQLVVERDRARALLIELEASRAAEARAAAAQERGRIARDMHDVLAHSLAGLSLQLQAIRAVAAKADVGPEVLAPLDRAAELARDGLIEARSAVGALRDPGGLGVDAIPALVERYPGNARFEVSGTPGAVSDAGGEAAYRAVQESLTNAARYAPGSPVVVALDWTDGLVVRIGDLGPAAGHSPVTGQGSGNGLAGMAKRAADCGGQVRTGPQDGGGWLVELTLPVVTP
jgi:signal transduction histidine kinase